MNQYIHIGAEVAAITALTICFEKKLKHLESRVETLEKQMSNTNGPRITLFEPTPQVSDKNFPTDFFMSFFPTFTSWEDKNTSSVSIEELQVEENPAKVDDPEEIKKIFLKHLSFLADSEAEMPDKIE